MADLVRFTLPNGGSVLVEIDQIARGTGPVGRREGVIRELGGAVEQTLASVRDAADAILETFQQASSPDEIRLSLGIKLTAEAGAVIARTAVEGNVNIELTWKAPQAVSGH
jgi:hypothetical protein